jgi:glucosamine-6-phosphate deaminase
MLVLTCPDADAVALTAADMVTALVRSRPAAVIGLAAGATPQAMYAELVRRHADGLDFSGVTVFGLDEYLDLDSGHPASCDATLRRHLVERVNLQPARTHLLDSRPAGDLLAVCAAHERAIAAAGGLDLQILGLGVNGHIGFNEPGCSLSGPTRPVGLSRSTRTVNKPAFAPDREVPALAVSMGIGTILAARRIMLLATGPAKACAVAGAVEGPVGARLPASALQMHADAVMILDEAAAAGLEGREDYDMAARALLARPELARSYGLSPSRAP